MGCVYIFTRWHIWSFKRCLDRMYELNVTIHCIKEVFGKSAATLTPWKAVDYRKYDVNMTVNIITKEDIGLVKKGLSGFWKV